MKIGVRILSLLLLFTFISCSDDDSTTESDTCADEAFFSGFPSRNFNMGFSTWAYGPDFQDRENTYQFIADNADVYSEQIDEVVPWQAWINDTQLPVEFTEEIGLRVSKKIPNQEMLLAVSLLNTKRDDLLEDVDGTIPNYTALSDQVIEDAYFKHLNYLINEFQPDYLVMAMEVNDLRLKSELKWNEYRLLAQNIRARIKSAYPALKLSESVTLHNWFNPEVPDPAIYINDIRVYVDQLDFAAISFYPFFKGQSTKEEFQQAFDFLHTQTSKSIAFVETTHIAEDLIIPAFNLSLQSDECQQNDYLESLLTNAQQNDYEFIIWWTHRDYDELWENFPADVRDVGQLWRDTGLLDQGANERISRATWQNVFSK